MLLDRGLEASRYVVAIPQPINLHGVWQQRKGGLAFFDRNPACAFQNVEASFAACCMATWQAVSCL